VANTLKPEELLTRRNLLLAGGALATAGLLWSLAVRQPNAQPVARTRTRRRPARLPPEEVLKPGALPELSIGREDAPITIVEYADLSCPACAHFHKNVLPELKKKYIDTGKVRLVFREFPTNVHSIIASMAMRCAGPEKAQPLISAIFARQREWTQATSISDIRKLLYPLAQQVGLSSETFDACVPSSEQLTTQQQQRLYAGLNIEGKRAHQGFGVEQTPTFFVNTTKLAGAATLEDFDKALAPLLNR
jgi:protein-disulfide isomerase